MSGSQQRILIQGPNHKGQKNYEDMLAGKPYNGIDELLCEKRDICKLDFLPQ
ncbi:MAG: hypothetical protein EZS28_035290, partial [Streblomastix strix]